MDSELNSCKQRLIPIIEKEMFQFFNELMPAEFFEQKEILRDHFNWEKAGFSKKPTGKRLRPFILLLVAESFGGDFEVAIPGAVAVEFIHNFSLIHDDIEDHDEYRHGRPTVWRKWGIEKAINAGDALFSLAFLSLSKFRDKNIHYQDIYTILGRTCAKLTGGQSMDLSFEGETAVTIKDYLLMISGKTASLFSACAEIGAFLGGGSVADGKRFAKFGQTLGMAFQLHDDWLGLWGQTELTGKTKGNDLVAGKKTFPIIYALEKNPDLYEKIEQAKGYQNIEDLIQEIGKTGAKEYTLNYENELVASALDELKQYQDSNRSKQALLGLIQSLSNRDF
jgi:geranylgeranyl diphosphate synthase type I